jgi:hypothetical protein
MCSAILEEGLLAVQNIAVSRHREYPLYRYRKHKPKAKSSPKENPKISDLVVFLLFQN